MAKIVIIEPDAATLELMSKLCRAAGHQVIGHTKGLDGITEIRASQPEIVILELRIGNVNGLDLASMCRDQFPNTAVIMVTGHGSVETAVEAMRLGVFDYLTKPFNLGDLVKTVSQALSRKDTALKTQPAVRPSMEPHSPSFSESSDVALKKANIVIIDDQAAILELMSKLCRAAGYQVFASTSGIEGVNVIRAQQPEVVIVDSHIGDFNGLDIVRLCRNEFPRTAVIMVTEHSSVQSAIEAMRLGAYDYITKPFDLGDLVNTVNQAFRRDDHLTQTQPAAPSSNTSRSFPIIQKNYKGPDYNKALASDGLPQKLTDTAEKYKEALRAFLACPETQVPITVSVEAPWGAGKTSFLHCLRSALEEQNQIPTVWFNPWKHEAGKTLWAAFAVAYERQMAKKLPLLRRWRKRVVLSLQRLSGSERMLLVLRLFLWLAGLAVLVWLTWQGVKVEKDKNSATVLMTLLNKHLPILGLPLLLWGLVKDLVGSLGTPLKVDMVSVFTRNQHQEGVDDLHRFHEDFNRLMRAYTPGTGPLERFISDLRQQTDPHWPEKWRSVHSALLVMICRCMRRFYYDHVIGESEHLNESKKPRWVKDRVVVFIDDLDRCEAPKAADMLQSLHLMLSGAGHERREPPPPGVICILGMDREKVAAAVAAKHEKLLPLLLPPEVNGKVAQNKAVGFGHEFLEKFIQITLHLPGLAGKDQVQYLKMITGWKGEDTTTLMSAASEVLNPPLSTQASQPSTDPLSGLLLRPVKEAMEQADESNRVQEAVKEVETHLHDGQTAFLCARYVASALEHNPRRLKQFVNLFRLRLYLASAMDVLDIATLDPTEKQRQQFDKLSAYDIAKLVALDLCCQQTMTDMREASAITHEALKKRIQMEHSELRSAAILDMVYYKSDSDVERNSPSDFNLAQLGIYFQQLSDR